MLGMQGRAARVTGVLACLALAALATAQETTVALSGRLRDATGGALEGAHVVVRDTQRGLAREGQSDERGFYRFLSLAPGLYSVSVAYAGFEAQERILTLGVGQDSSADFVLRVAGLRTSTEVVAASPASPALGARVDGETVRAMPLDGRDLARVALLQPGVTWTRASVESAATGRGTRFSVGGAGPSQNAFVVDGTVINDALGHTPGSAQGLMLGVDSLQEFRVLTGVLGAEHGRAAGGVFLAVTRSGTNTWQGSVFEFFRNDALDAPTYFDVRKPDFNRNQFGASVGGPLRANRTFVFATYEGLRQGKGITQTALVPDADARRGVVGGVNVGIDPRIAPYLALYPLPNGPALGGGSAQYISVLDQESVADMATARLDHNFTALDGLSVRYSFENSRHKTPRAFKEMPNLTRNRKHVWTAEGRRGIAKTGLASLRFGVSKSRPFDDFVPVDTPLQIVAGKPFGEITVPGLSDFGTDRATPASFGMTDLSSQFVVTLPRGDHLFKAGLSAQRMGIHGVWETRTRGQLRFRSVADLLRFRLQDLQAASADSDFERNYSQWALGAFAQDEWRIGPRLKVDLGLRWERATAPIERDGKTSNVRQLSDSQPTVGGALIKPTALNLAPRLGLVWDLAGDGRTLLRGGAGVFDDLPLFQTWRGTAFRALPFANRGRLTSVASLPVPVALIASSERSTDSVDYDMNRTYLVKWGAEVGHEFPRGISASLSYSGAAGRGLLSLSDVNIAIPATAADGMDFFPEGAPRRYPAFDVNRRVQGGYSSRFHALGVTVARRSSTGPSFQATYRLGRTTDNVAGFGSLSWSVGQPRSFDPYNRDLDIGPANFDVRHAVSVIASHRFRWRLRGVFAVLNNLGLDATFQFASGEPFTPIIEGDPDRDGTDQNAARPDRVPGVSLYPAGGSTAGLWFNPAAFAPPTPGRRGTASRNLLRSPGFATINASVSRRIGIGHRSLDVRAEVFNLLNRVNLSQPLNSDGAEAVFSYAPPTSTSPATFTVPGGVGRIFSIQGTAREIQLGVRFTF